MSESCIIPLMYETRIIGDLKFVIMFCNLQSMIAVSYEMMKSCAVAARQVCL